VQNRSWSGAPDLVTARRQIERWRQTRAKRSPMPEPLWQAAVGLVQTHGVRGTAVGLGICYKSLRKRLASTTARASLEKAAPRPFVEVRPMPTPTWAVDVLEPSAPIVLELNGVAGQRLALRLSSSEQLKEASLLIRECWSHPR
jgi:hypothetical protein